MKGAGFDFCRIGFFLYARPHLLGCLVRKGETQDLRWLNLVVRNQVFHAFYNYPGLAAAWAGYYQESTISWVMGYRTLLVIVQVREGWQS